MTLDEKTVAVDMEAVALSTEPDPMPDAATPETDTTVSHSAGDTIPDTVSETRAPVTATHDLQPAPVAAPEPAPEAEWMAQIKLLHKRFGEQERLSAERERVIDRLHEENQKLKQGELLKQMMPVYRDLMRLYDDLEKAAVEYAAKEEIAVQKAVDDWRFFATSVTDLLYRYGVDVMTIEAGQAFDAKSHRAAAVKKTGVAEQEKTVARMLSAGFTSDGRILRPAAIEVFRYEKPIAVERETEELKEEIVKEEIKGEAIDV